LMRERVFVEGSRGPHRVVPPALGVFPSPYPRLAPWATSGRALRALD
jgi:hypothetical protein